MATPVSGPHPAKLGVLPRLAVVLYLLALGVSLALPVILTWLLYRFLYRVAGEALPFLFWFIVLYPVVGWLWWLRLALIVAANLTFMVWLYVRYRELAARGARVRYSAHWAITGFFVPFLNFVRPYQVVADACKAAAALHRPGGTPRTPRVVTFWWVLVLVSVVLGAVGGKSVMPGRMEMDAMLLAAYLTVAAVCGLSIAVIAALEKERLGNDGARPLGLLGPWPLPLAASVAAVLAVLLVLGGAYGFARNEMSQIASAGAIVAPPELIPQGVLPPPPPPPKAQPVESTGDAKGSAEVLVKPIKVPGEAEGVAGGVVGGVPGGVPGGQLGGVIGGIIGSVPPPPPARKEAAPSRVRIGPGVMEGNLVHKVDPVYPSIARQARVQGTVTMAVVVGKNGTIENLKVVSGHPLLVQAALDAVRQWRYKPFLLNGEPMEVETQINVNFKLEEKNP